MKVFKDYKELAGWEITDTAIMNGKHSCKLCGHAIRTVVKIEKGGEVSQLGTDCARKIATANNAAINIEELSF